MERVDTTNSSRRPVAGGQCRTHERGATAIQMVVILVPVAFGLIGFAVDLGMLYSAKNDLQMAANAMAIAAAQRLIGTDSATDAATAAAHQTIETGTGFGNKYNFNGLPVGRTTGNLVSNAPIPSYFSTVVDATSADSSDPIASDRSRRTVQPTRQPSASAKRC